MSFGRHGYLNDTAAILSAALFIPAFYQCKKAWHNWLRGMIIAFLAYAIVAYHTRFGLDEGVSALDHADEIFRLALLLNIGNITLLGLNPPSDAIDIFIQMLCGGIVTLVWALYIDTFGDRVGHLFAVNIGSYAIGFLLSWSTNKCGQTGKSAWKRPVQNWWALLFGVAVLVLSATERYGEVGMGYAPTYACLGIFEWIVIHESGKDDDNGDGGRPGRYNYSSV